MRYKIECKSLLLQKALEEFLKDYLSDDGFVISDEKGDIIIGKDIKKPFSKSQLLLQLERVRPKAKTKPQQPSPKELEIDMSIFDELIDTPQKENFDEKLDKLILEFSTKLKHLIKEEYGKK